MHAVVYKLVGAVFRAKKIFPGLEGTFIHRAPMCMGINSSCHSLQAITVKVGTSPMKAPFNFSRSNAASFGRINILEGRFLFREVRARCSVKVAIRLTYVLLRKPFRKVSHPPRATFKTTSSSTVVATLLTTAVKAYFEPSPHPTPSPRPVVTQPL